MTTRRFLTLAGAVAAFAAGPAYAQHDHGGTGCSCAPHAAAPASQAIAEGTVENGVRTVQMQVTEDGYVPAKIKANRGEKLRLVVTRTTDRTCAKEIVIEGAGINTPLPLDKAVTVEVTPKKSGELKYACGMDMLSGVILVP
jgi:plastocyanin domain-containing protein